MLALEAIPDAKKTIGINERCDIDATISRTAKTNDFLVAVHAAIHPFSRKLFPFLCGIQSNALDRRNRWSVKKLPRTNNSSGATWSFDGVEPAHTSSCAFDCIPQRNGKSLR